jgi:uncharacterized protein YbjT (DUF2867 family)
LKASRMTRHFMPNILAYAAVLYIASAAAASANEGVLVFGGTGELGREVIEDLQAAGEEVTIFARPSSETADLEAQGVAVLRGDVLNEDDVARALEAGPFRVVVDALARDRGVDADFYDVSMEYIARAGLETGVEHIILHGSVGAGLSQLSDRAREEDMGDLMISKTMGERHLMESGVTYTIIRNWALLPNDIKESGEAYMTPDQTARGLITRDALARFTVQCLTDPMCENEILHTVDDAVNAREPYISRLQAQRDWEAEQRQGR